MNLLPVYLAIPFLLASCNSMESIKKGDIIGGLIAAPFEIAGGAMETAFVPLGGNKPQWVKDAEISNMKASKPKLADPAWRTKFDKELKAGEILLSTFAENLEAYKLTSHERYLSHAEQLVTNAAERSALEEQVLRSLGAKAFDVDIHINGQSTTAKYSERESKVLFFTGNVRGAKVNPKGRATVRLRNDLPFKIKDSYQVTVRFKFVIPRQSTVYFMGMKNTAARDSVGTVDRTYTFGPGVTSAEASLDFGELSGAGTVAVLGSQSKIELTDEPYTSFDITGVVKR